MTRGARAVAALPWLVWLGVFLWGCPAVREPWRPDWDGGLYILLGRSLASGDGYRYLGAPFFLRPPGLPWIYSFLLPAQGPPPFTLLNGVTWFFACAAGLGATLVSRPLLGPILSLVPGLFLIADPAARGIVNRTLSDFPSLAFTFAAIVLLERWGREGEGRRGLVWGLAGATVLAIAFYFRSATIVLVPALAIWGLRKQGRRALAPLALTVLLMAPWLLWTRWAASQPPPGPGPQLLLHDYVTATLRAKPGDPRSPLLGPDKLWTRTRRNTADVLESLARQTVGTASPLGQGIFVLLAGMGVAVALARGAGLLEWYAGTALVLVCGYFVVDPRLTLPIVAPCALYMLAGTRWAAAEVARLARVARRETVGSALAAALGLLLLWSDASVKPFTMVPQERIERTSRAAEWVAANTPPGTTVLCRTAPVLSVLSGRTAYTYQFGFRPPMLDREPGRIDLVVLDGDVPFDAREFEARAERGLDLPTAAGPVRILCLRPCRLAGFPAAAP